MIRERLIASEVTFYLDPDTVEDVWFVFSSNKSITADVMVKPPKQDPFTLTVNATAEEEFLYNISQVRGGPFDNWGGGGGGVEENMEINKIFFILLKINKKISTLLKINKLFLDVKKK